MRWRDSGGTGLDALKPFEVTRSRLREFIAPVSLCFLLWQD